VDSADLLQLESDLQSLGLNVMAAHVGEYAERAARDNTSYIEFLRDVLRPELDMRQTRWVDTRIKLAGFPFRKTLADFDFAFQPAVDERLVRELATLSFLDRHENVIFLGPPGVGKSHLAIALGMEAIRHRAGVYFTTAHSLVTDLRTAQARGNFEARLRVYTKPRLLIIDELTYAPFDQHDAANFFRLVSERYERGSIILTANRSYGEWGQLFHDPVLATAILDRLLHHSVTLNIKGGHSYRLKDKTKAGILGPEASAGLIPASTGV